MQQPGNLGSRRAGRTAAGKSRLPSSLSCLSREAGLGEVRQALRSPKSARHRQLLRFSGQEGSDGPPGREPAGSVGQKPQVLVGWSHWGLPVGEPAGFGSANPQVLGEEQPQRRTWPKTCGWRPPWHAGSRGGRPPEGLLAENPRVAGPQTRRFSAEGSPGGAPGRESAGRPLIIRGAQELQAWPLSAESPGDGQARRRRPGHTTRPRMPRAMGSPPWPSEPGVWAPGHRDRQPHLHMGKVSSLYPPLAG